MAGVGGALWEPNWPSMITVTTHGINRKKMVVQIVDDGSFLFSVPSSVYWISHRYGIPVLAIVLNNKSESFLFS